MSEWRVELLGDLIDLQYAYEAFSSVDPCVIREESRFFLKANEFEYAPDSGHVRSRASEITKLISNAVHLHYRATRPIMIGHVIHIDDTGQSHHFVFANDDFQSREVVAGIVIDGTDFAPTATSVLHIFRAARDRTNVSDALAYFSQGDWINLYKIYEIARDTIGNEKRLIERRWVTRDALKRFTQTAQSRDAIGDSARHAAKKYKAPPNPMSVHEARALVGDLLQRLVDTFTAL